MEEESVPPAGTKILIHYTKAQGHRTVHVDGVIGGPTPNSMYLAINFFNERGSHPETTIHTIEENGVLAMHKIDQQINSRPGIWREIDFSTVLDLKTAKSFHSWLGRNIASLERQQLMNAPILENLDIETEED